jgi:hypothetical protein
LCGGERERRGSQGDGAPSRWLAGVGECGQP